MLLNLINDLLDLAKINSLKFKFNENYFYIKESIQKACQNIKYIAD